MPESLNNVFEPHTYHRFYSLFQDYNVRLASLVKTMVGNVSGPIVDLACGTGLSTAALRKCWPEATIVGVDISDEMVSYAGKTMHDTDCRFQTRTMRQVVEDFAQSPASMFFVKSAYHYFDDELSPGDITASLDRRGAFVVAERTARSASSYPLPEITRTFWEAFFSQPKVDRRFAEAERHSLDLSASCLGEWVDIPASVYRDAVSHLRLFGLSATAPSVVEEWLENLAEPGRPVKVWEEFWLYVYRKPNTSRTRSA